MDLSELLLTVEQLGLFLICLALVFTIYYYFKSILPHNKINIRPEILVVLLYIIFLIVNRIINTNIFFSAPLTKYLIQKKNFRQEPYHINYVNPFVTNLDKVDFNMKKNENKKYIKNILSQLLLRKYVNFQNVLGYIENPWNVIELKLVVGTTPQYDLKPTKEDITNNQYCMNYLEGNAPNFLLLYRKHILKFIDKQYFIFERKYKKHSKYYLKECISQVVNNNVSGLSDTIIDTRDLYYDRQYVLFINFPASVSSDVNKWTAPPSTTAPVYNPPNTDNPKLFLEQPTSYYWQDDNTIYDVIVLDIYFIYNQMKIMNEDIFNPGDKQDFALNKFYEYQSWIEKKYYNFIINQFKHRINTTNETVQAQNIIANTNDTVNDMLTIKIRKNISKFLPFGTKFTTLKFDLKLTKNPQNSQLILSNNIPINFMNYIKTYIQNVSEKQANELVVIKNKNTKSYKDNDLLLDKNTISYVSFDFLNIKSIKEYKNKMNYLANSILDKYYKKELKSIDNIKYNMSLLKIIQLDKLYRYNSGRSRLILNNKTITPNNINKNFNDIKKLRLSYELFLEKILKYKQTLQNNVNNKTYSLNVTNNELLSFLNYNPFNKKLNYLCKIKTINQSTGSISNSDFPNNHNNDLIIGSNTLVKLEIEPNTYKAQDTNVLFVKFATTMNIDNFNINPDNVYVVYTTTMSNILVPKIIYLEKYLLLPDISGNITKILKPRASKTLTNSINLFDCTSSFRKETIGVSNLIEIKDSNTFNLIFDNNALEFKSTFGASEDTSTGNMFIERPNYVMLNYSRNTKINPIISNIFENQLYKVIDVKSTTSSSSAILTLESLIGLTQDPNRIFKNIQVSQFINSENYIENVYFKKVEIPKEDKLLSSGPNYKFVVALNEQIINITPEITRNDIIADYETSMNKIINYIYENEAKRIHYKVPENIGVYLDKTSALYVYKYTNDLYISYDKRNKPVSIFKDYDTNLLCRKVYTGSNYYLNQTALYFLDNYQDYYKYFLNLFKNTLGLYDDMNYQCTEYYKSGSMLSNLRLPMSFNKYVTFSNNYMLYYKTNIIVDDIDNNLLGKHIVLNNTTCDNTLLNINNSNRQNSKLFKDFLKNFIFKHEIGRKGFEYEDAKKICERIFTVYDKDCENKVYKTQPKKLADYNPEYYKHNKERDSCFSVLYNDEKEKNTYQFIADSKILDPTNSKLEVSELQENLDKVKKLKNTCAAKLDKQSCDTDPMCYYSNDKCKSLLNADEPMVYRTDGYFIGRVIGIELANKFLATIENIDNDRLQVKLEEITLTDDLLPTKGNTISTKIYNMNNIPITGIGTVSDSIIGVGSIKFNHNAYDISSGKLLIGINKNIDITSSNPNPPSSIYYDNNGNNIKDKKIYIEFITNENENKNTSKIKLIMDENSNIDEVDIRDTYKTIYIKNIDIIKDKIIKVDNNILNGDELITPGDYGKAGTFSIDYKMDNDSEKFIQNQGGIEKFENKLKYMLRVKKQYTRNKDLYNEQKILIIEPLANIVKNTSRPTITFTQTDIDNFNNRTKTLDESSDYKSIVSNIEKSGNLRFYPHRLAHLNEIKTAAYYGADWDSIGWINNSNPVLENKSNLVKIKDKKVMWIDPNDENAINKGVVCYGRKLDQNKIGANDKNELYNFQMEKIEQSIKDIRKYENVSDFSKNIYSRWNL